MNRYDKVASRINGPCGIIHTPFTHDGDIDEEALARFVEHLVDGGLKVIYTTGSTEILSLSEREVYRVTEVVSRVNRGRAVFIASTGPWNPNLCLDFIRHAQRVGVDVVKIMTPWWIGLSETQVMAHWRTIAAVTDCPLFGYTVGEPGLSQKGVEELAAIPQFIGMKNDSDNFFGQLTYLRSGRKEFRPITGGSMQTIWFGHAFGARCWADVTATIKPTIALAYWEHLEAGRLEEAKGYIDRYDRPLNRLRVLYSAELGYMLSKVALWLMGLFPTPCMRMPYGLVPKVPLEQADFSLLREMLEEWGC